MKEITKYEAFDGTVFNDEMDCRRYELEKQMGDISGLKLFTFEGDEIDIADMRSYEGACFAYVPTDTCASYLKDVSATYGPDLPEDTGFWVYNEDDWYWENIETLNERLDPYRRINTVLDRCGIEALKI